MSTRNTKELIARLQATNQFCANADIRTEDVIAALQSQAERIKELEAEITTRTNVIDEIKCNTDTPIGASYWRGEKKELTHAACIDVGSFLEQCDERAYEEIGEIYNNCFTDVGDDAKNELGDLILEWAKKHVNIQYWKVINSQELKIAAEDLE